MTGKILIVDDLAINRIILKAKLGSACYETLTAETGAQAIAMARSRRPDLILLDMMLEDTDGVAVCRSLRADPVTAHIPVLIITASTEQAQRNAALAAGANEFLSKPVDETTLLARIRNLLRAAETEAEWRRQETWCSGHGLAEPAAGFVAAQTRVALLGATPQMARFWRKQVAPLCPQMRFESIGTAEALSYAEGAAPDVFMIVAESPVALRLLLDLQARRATRHSAYCVILPPEAGDQAAMALDLGAHDLLHLPLDAEETALRLGMQITRKRRADALRRTVERGLNLAALDPLTGLLNRRGAEAKLLHLALQARQNGEGFAVLLLDLDRFKAINDTHGHGVGDEVLRQVAARMRSVLSPQDVIVRYGGEEFLIALAGVSLERARAQAQVLCDVIEQTPIATAGGEICVTVSVGVAPGQCGADGEDMRQALARTVDQADRALLASKSHGRNRVTVFEAAPLPR